MEEYLTTIEHLKPTPRKVLFLWSAVEVWLHGGSSPVFGGYRKDRGQDKGLIKV
jgi:hypothetical protein